MILRWKLLLLTVFCLSLGLQSASATAADLLQLPLPPDAREQMRLTDKTPAVLHYYTRLSFAELSAFYQQQLGSPIQQKTQLQQLQLYFQRDQQRLRIVIREQDGWRDVSIMLQ